MARKRLTTRQAASRLDLEQKEVLRRIRTGQIPAKKFDWIWTIAEDDIPMIMEQDWYKRIQAVS